jgi:hypothetical protein
MGKGELPPFIFLLLNENGFNSLHRLIHVHDIVRKTQSK